MFKDKFINPSPVTLSPMPYNIAEHTVIAYHLNQIVNKKNK
jgi:hypothetical protein